MDLAVAFVASVAVASGAYVAKGVLADLRDERQLCSLLQSRCDRAEARALAAESVRDALAADLDLLFESERAAAMQRHPAGSARRPAGHLRPVGEDKTCQP